MIIELSQCGSFISDASTKILKSQGMIQVNRTDHRSEKGDAADMLGEPIYPMSCPFSSIIFAKVLLKGQSIC